MRQPSIRVAEPVLNGNERKYVLDCLDSTWISSRGKYIEKFEAQVAEFVGVDHAVATNNGTTALHLALAALNLQPGDEVIVPTLTYIASVNAIRYCGATPVFVDSVSPSMTLDPDQIEAKITPRTRGIVSVPLYGHPVHWDKLQSVADRHGLFVVEDAAEALGASYRNRMVGSWGDCATFSFFGNKIITTGEGGMVVTQDAELAARLRLLRGQAVSPERCYWHNEVGYNYRMTNVAAAIGCAQMEQIEHHLSRRQSVAAEYFEVLTPHRDRFQLPDAAPDAHHCYWMYSVVLHSDLPFGRDEVMAGLAEAGVETRPVFYPVHWMPPYQEALGSYPVAEALAGRGISLPTHGKLTNEDIRFVAKQLVNVVDRLTERSRTVRKAA